jgi:hypothetical protein
MPQTKFSNDPLQRTGKGGSISKSERWILGGHDRQNSSDRTVE